MAMILSGLLKHVRGGLDLKRFDHIFIRVGGGTGTKKKIGPHTRSVKNHLHIYFFENTLQLIMVKYGFEPFLTTKYPITGPTRENTIFCLGR